MRENTFEHKKKETGVKFNPGLSSNRPLNNWDLILNPNSHRITPYHASPRGQESK